MSKGLSAQLLVSRAGFALNLSLDVPAGTVLALLGPNGAGKSTALQALAGLLPLGAGSSVVLDGQLLDRVPVPRRRVGMVFQDYLLFPHLSAVDNVAFGLQARGMPRRQARTRAAERLAGLGLTGVQTRRPGALSGGQAQRVALARALVTAPRLLLLDEPLAALDAGTRAEVRTGLRRELTGYDGATVLVTHDPLDAMVLADAVVVLEQGCAVQNGPPAELARAPRTPYVASLVGLNLHAGTAQSGGQVAVDGGGTLLAAGSVDVNVPAPGSAALVAYRPAAVAVHRRRPDGSARNAWPGVITGLEQHAGVVRVQVRALPGDGRTPVLADVTPAAVAELGLEPGLEVWLAVKATEVSLFGH